MQIWIKIILQEIIDKYYLTNIVEDGWVYIKIAKEIYGLPTAGKLANDLFKKRLVTAGYHRVQFSPGLWKHAWQPPTFSLVVDNFGIKVEGNTHANHHVNTLKKWYEVTIDWKGGLYVGVGVKLEWDYANRMLDTHVPGFVKKSASQISTPQAIQTPTCSSKIKTNPIRCKGQGRRKIYYSRPLSRWK